MPIDTQASNDTEIPHFWIDVGDLVDLQADKHITGLSCEVAPADCRKETKYEYLHQACNVTMHIIGIKHHRVHITLTGWLFRRLQD